MKQRWPFEIPVIRASDFTKMLFADKCQLYSYRSASIGSSMLARRAG